MFNTAPKIFTFLRMIPALKHDADFVSCLPSGNIDGISILTFFLAYTLTFYLTFYLASVLAFYLSFLQAFHLAFVLFRHWSNRHLRTDVSAAAWKCSALSAEVHRPRRVRVKIVRLHVAVLLCSILQYAEKILQQSAVCGFLL